MLALFADEGMGSEKWLPTVACEGWDLNTCLCLFFGPCNVASGATSVCLFLSSIPGHHAEGVLLLLRYDKADRSGDDFH